MSRRTPFRNATILSSYARRFQSTVPLQAHSILKAPELDFKAIVQNQEALQRNCIARNLPHLADTIPEIVSANSLRLKCIHDRTPLQVRRLNIQKEIQKLRVDNQKARLFTEALEIKSQLAQIKAVEDSATNHLIALMAALPNTLHPDVPSVEQEVGTIGVLRKKETVKDHVEIAESLGLLDLRTAAKATGHAWYYLKGMGVRLEMALVSYAIDMAVKHGWKLVKTPDVVRTEVALACGFRPRDEQGDQIYQLANVAVGDTGVEAEHGSLCLAGTAEIPLAAMHIDSVISETELPLKYVGVGTSYRAEAGSRGKDSKGLYRVHQFTKVELFAWTRQEESDAMLSEILDLQKNIVEGLGLHARILDMPAHELGNAAYRKYDIEAWMYGRRGWGEITSASNCTDYQSRRLHTKYRLLDGRHFHTHTLNGTAMAVPRMIIAILENGLKSDGSVEIPLALQKFIDAEHIKQ